jgi:carbonic anhydrase
MRAGVKTAVAAVSGYESDRASGNPAFVQAVAVKNVELTMARILQRSSIMRAMVESGEIGLAGAMYEITPGA